jgi:hypothetical protein
MSLAQAVHEQDFRDATVEALGADFTTSRFLPPRCNGAMTGGPVLWRLVACGIPAEPISGELTLH